MDNHCDFSRPPPFQEHFFNALDKLEQIDWSYVFLRPFNSSDYPNYNDIVKQPMDYSTMRKKIKGYHYWSFDHFLKDFNLIIDNCLVYLPEVSVIHAAALDTRKQSLPIMQELHGNITRVVDECPQIPQSSPPITMENRAGFTPAACASFSPAPCASFTPAPCASFTPAPCAAEEALPVLDASELETELGESSYSNAEAVEVLRSPKANENVTKEMSQLVSEDELAQEMPPKKSPVQEAKEADMSLLSVAECESLVQEAQNMEVRLHSTCSSERELSMQETQLQEARIRTITPLQSASEQVVTVPEAQVMDISLQNTADKGAVVHDTTDTKGISLMDTSKDVHTPAGSTRSISSTSTSTKKGPTKYPTKRERMRMSYYEQLNILVDIISETKAKKQTVWTIKKLQKLGNEYKRLSSLVSGFPPLTKLFSTGVVKRGRPRAKRKVCRKPESETETLSQVIEELGEAQRRKNAIHGSAKRSASSSGTNNKQANGVVVSFDSQPSKPNYVEWFTGPELDVGSDTDEGCTSDKTEEFQYSTDDADSTETMEQSSDRTTKSGMSLRNRRSVMFRPRCSFFGPRRASTRLHTLLSSDQVSGPSYSSVVDSDSEFDAADAHDYDGESSCRRRTKQVARRTVNPRGQCRRKSKPRDPGAVSGANIVGDVLRGRRMCPASNRKPSKSSDIVSSEPAAAVIPNATILKPCVVKLQSLNAADLQLLTYEQRESLDSLVEDSIVSCVPVSDASSETKVSLSSMPVLVAHEEPMMFVENEEPENDVADKSKKDRLLFWSQLGSRKKRKLLTRDAAFVRAIAKRELLIIGMRKHPGLWNVPVKENKDKMPHKATWQNIAFDSDCSVTKVQKQWHGLYKDFHTECKKIEKGLPPSLKTPDVIARVAWSRWYLFHQLMYLHSPVKAEECPSTSKSLNTSALEGDSNASIPFLIETTEEEVIRKLAHRPWRLPSTPTELHSTESSSSSLSTPERCRRETRQSLKRSRESGSPVDTDAKFDMFGKRIGQLASQLPSELSSKCMKLVSEVMESFMVSNKVA